MKSPIFIFSLPRSGSTLLQKILMSNSDIASISEPWVLLPYIYIYKNTGVVSEYSHGAAYKAVSGFIDNFPNKEDDYYDCLGFFLHTLYSKQCKKNETYFLDKTPRYYLIIDEINYIFPDAKFIFLFRNPIHIYSSVITTFCKNRLKNLYLWKIDLIKGPQLLSEGYKKLEHKSFGLQYEDFVKDPKKITQEICDFLEINFSESMLKMFNSQDLKGNMGDMPGAKEYKSMISVNSLDKWKSVFNTRLRRNLLFKYINNIDESIIDIQGYNKLELIKSVNNLDLQGKFGVFNDLFDLLYSETVFKFKLNVIFVKSLSWIRGVFLS